MSPLRRLALAAICLLALRAEAAEPVRLVVGDLPPFATEKGDPAPGALVEVTQELARRMKLPLTVEFYPWQRALTVTKATRRTLVLPITRTPEREANYNWVVRLYIQDFVFCGLKGHHDLADTEGLKRKRIAVLRGSPHKTTLAADGFRHLIECSTVSDCMRMVETGVADATFGGEAIHRSLLNAGEFAFSPPLRNGEIWLAGSPDFSAADAAEWQAALQSMRADGSYKRILSKYKLPLERP